MAFTLRWTNNNPTGSVVTVYRDTKAIVLTALPAPLATLSNGEQQYTDTTATIGTTYFYLLAVTVNGKTLYGPARTATVFNRRGVGSMTLAVGNEDIGYIGTPDFAERFTYADLPSGFQALTGLSTAVQIAVGKVMLDGKVFYVFPNFRVTSNLFTWDQIYNAGLMYGVDGPGPDGGRGNLAPVDQGGLFDFQGDTYRIRCMRGLSDRDASPVMTLPTALNGVNHDTTAYGTCEFNDIVYPWCQWIPKKQRVVNYQQNLLSWMFPAGAANASKGAICQERDSVSNKCIQRGTGAGAVAEDASFLPKIFVTDSTTTGLYMPIIELME